MIKDDGIYIKGIFRITPPFKGIVQMKYGGSEEYTEINVDERESYSCEVEGQFRKKYLMFDEDGQGLVDGQEIEVVIREGDTFEYCWLPKNWKESLERKEKMLEWLKANKIQ
jgi:hypothetical protein